MSIIQNIFSLVSKRATEEKDERFEEAKELLLKAMAGKIDIGKKECLEIPIVSRSINLIENTISILNLQLFENKDGKVVEIKNDKRINILNKNTGDIYSPNLLKKSLVEDYLLYGVGRAYLNKKLNKLESIHYVDKNHISRIYNTDPIYKKFKILVDGKEYNEFDFLSVYKKMNEHGKGIGIIEENKRFLGLLYAYLKYEQNLVNGGGNKKGFLKSEKKLSKEAFEELKNAWAKLYSDNSSNVVILNNGLDFKEASNTSVEMQLKENKQANDTGMSAIFQIPWNLLNGKYSDSDYIAFLKMSIIPILSDFECALNKNLLLESEKENMYFSFSLDDLLKGDQKSRYESYKTAIDANFLTIDEVRRRENMEDIGLKFIKLGLQDVLFNPETQTIYTPNTNKTTSVDNNIEGGENNV